MQEEIYKIRCPGHILFGDPLCLEEKERFMNVLVDYTPDKNFDARIVLKETPAPDDKNINLLSMELYFSPAEDMHVYLKNMMFGGQETETKGVAVDTAQYRIEVDERYLNVHTGGDGWWGSFTEFYRGSGSGKVSDAVILTVWVPEEEGFEGMKQMAGYLFGELHPIEKAPVKRQDRVSR